MISTDQLRGLIADRAGVIDASGVQIGRIDHVVLDDETGEPEWVVVGTGPGVPGSFVPMDGATVDGQDVRVPFTARQVAGAPSIAGADGALTREQRVGLFRHYASSGEVHGTVLGSGSTGDARGTVVTRSEERLRAGTERVAVGRARLRRVVVTENKTFTVAVSHEEVRLVQEPIGEPYPGDLRDDVDTGSRGYEMVLREERVVITKETVPVERVRLVVDTVAGTEQVSAQVRKEHVVLETVDVARDDRAL